MDVQQEDQPEREADERLIQHLRIMDSSAHLDPKSSRHREQPPVWRQGLRRLRLVWSLSRVACSFKTSSVGYNPVASGMALEIMAESTFPSNRE